MEYSVIKEDDLFLTTEKSGDVEGSEEKGYGLYTKDTRFLSKFELMLNDSKPSLLSSDDDENYRASMRLVEVEEDKGATEALRERFIYDGILYERMTFTNYFLEERTLKVNVHFDVDFRDMFLVRGFATGETGEKTGITYEDQSMVIGYQGKDDVPRETRITWKESGAHVVEEGEVEAIWTLAPQERKTLTFMIHPVINGGSKQALEFEEALGRLENSYEEWTSQGTKIDSDHPIFNKVYHRGVIDTRMLMTDVGFGDVPVAGVPWYSVPFGRDSLITSLFLLPFQPEQVKGTLQTLAHYQGKEENLYRDEQPGKIMHELRSGELASTGQIPFTPYYGTVDATPLFVILATEYYNWTKDEAFLKQMKPSLDKAIEWIDQYGSIRGDGFVQYQQTTDAGFVNQGWKDSDNSNVHEDGTLAKDPISLVEVQGYVYQAKTTLADVYKEIGETERAEQLREEAELLSDRFEKAFWMEEEQFYALGLDGEGKQIKALTSNPGHLLMSGISEEQRERSVAEKLVGKSLFSGYGVRTMSDDSTGYYPMSYHNGSVWPHDNAMILLGLSQVGKSEAVTVIEGLLDAAEYFEHLRLPELFCGYSKEEGHLVPYPTTCSPQAWAATASFVFLQSISGVEPDAYNEQIIVEPAFPQGMTRLKVEDMRIGEGRLSLVITKEEEGYAFEVSENTSGWELTFREKVVMD
ncbi:amylo-alpha-1,6-glucosidase [Salimicrobium halophilum]|uniref:Glycogen debranching enzyme (Alpha-1,6-glucosidase) n=1 Tax=Salimicrobium halophilum TaxID=86666 RepID=A0A1G8UVR1_9BACI|nr:amylo-alpha-1,6-glucosidase [Salimicrobium halophilum]SDJ57657.1 Glycogen debranching enzyme (alpha-1,6-glucosidase) [Salimicrobium halophilum]